jgi:hypothetical protein
MSESKNLEIKADFYGLNTLRKAVRDVDPELAKQLSKSVERPVRDVYNSARRMVKDADVPSGWKRRSNGPRGWGDPTQRAWDNAKVRSGIKMNIATKSKSRGGVKPLYRIVNLSPAGAIYEYARVARTPQGASFIRKLNEQRPSRLIWKAWDDAGGDRAIIPAINEAITEVYVEFEKQIKSVPAGDRVGFRR